MTERDRQTNQDPNILGFTKHDVALGAAAFVAAVDTVVVAPLSPGRMISPLAEGDMVFRATWAFLETHLPGSTKRNK